MDAYKIVNLRGQTVFKGQFSTYKSCLEMAITDNVNLNNIDLKHQNLMGANLDGADFSRCDFSHANLTNANLSETNISDSIFHHTDLYNTCLAESTLQNCDFRDTNFGATHIYDSDLSGSHFSSLSCFSLPFMEAKTMDECLFWTAHKEKVFMTSPPVVIRGISPHPIIFLDDKIITENGLFDRMHWMAFLETKELTNTSGCHKI